VEEGSEESIDDLEDDELESGLGWGDEEEVPGGGG
jgi:hypothetical protein